MSLNGPTDVTPTVDLQIAFELPQSLARLLRLLMESKLLTSRDIVHTHKIATDGKVAIHRLRRYLENHDLEIKSRRELGYWLEPSTKEKISKIAYTGQMSLPLDHGGTPDDIRTDRRVA